MCAGRLEVADKPMKAFVTRSVSIGNIWLTCTPGAIYQNDSIVPDRESSSTRSPRPGRECPRQSSQTR
eukprot:961831-Pyramimonas_sp.AAC.1